MNAFSGSYQSTLPESLQSLDQRSRDIFRIVVDSYLRSGTPLGSRSLSRQLPMSLSPASVRNVLSDLESLGLIYSPHVSAGRLPTQLGLRFFIDAFMEVGALSPDERSAIDAGVAAAAGSTETMLTDASRLLSGLSHGAGLVITSKADPTLRHIEFIRLEPQKALAVLVGGNDEVENRVIELPAGITSSQLTEAANFLNANVTGMTIADARRQLERLKEETRSALHELSSQLVEKGLAVWSGDGAPTRLIVRGRGNLLDSIGAAEDIERLRHLFDDLERKDSLIELLSLAEEGPGVRIFIGSENKLFSLSGSSLVVAPYRDSERRVLGAVGIIGPTRLNYSRIVPMVDYTAQLVSRLMGG